MSYANPPKGRIISRNKLNDMKLVGQGSFGRVYKATWLAKDEYSNEYEKVVAIKVMKNATTDEVLSERNRMAGLDHVNVVGLCGVVWQKGATPWLVMEYAEKGDLQSNISSCVFNGYTMMRICWHVAKGMEYLHDNGITHGDLAARNILLDVNNVAKIGDLGYFDTNNSENYYNYQQKGMPCPIRWMSPENLPYRLDRGRLVEKKGTRSFKGDVWAFGVVLFEVWSRGAIPFKDYDHWEVCKFVLDRKKATHFYRIRMRRHVRNLMHSCWQYDPDYRPTFSKIVRHFVDNSGFESDEESETSYNYNSSSCSSSSSGYYY